MQIVKFIYNSVDVEESVFLLLYLRLLGIYVYEQQIDMAEEVPFLLEGLEELREQTTRDFECDAWIYLLCRTGDATYGAEEVMKLQADQRKKMVVLVAEDLLDEQLKEAFGEAQIVSFSTLEEQREELLQQLTEAFYKGQVIGEDEKDSLDFFARKYCEHDVCRLTLSTRFFYAQSEEFEGIVQKYRKVYAEFRKKLNEMESQWGDSRTIHMQAAVLNLVFDVDSYARKCKKAMPYTPDSCIRVSDRILTEAGGKLDDSIRLLQGQIYSELLDKEKEGFDCYLQTCKDYNAYAYFKKALSLERVNSNHEKAVQYYKKSVVIFPEYYRAWNAMGMCYCRMAQWEEALHAFARVKRILSHKRENGCLRPLEIDYLFQSLRRQGKIYADKMGDIPRALRMYKEAESVWNKIAEQSFWNYMYSEPEEIERAKKMIRERLKIKVIYSRLSMLNHEMGNSEKAEEYYSLYEKMGE